MGPTFLLIYAQDQKEEKILPLIHQVGEWITHQGKCFWIVFPQLWQYMCSNSFWSKIRKQLWRVVRQRVRALGHTRGWSGAEVVLPFHISWLQKATHACQHPLCQHTERRQRCCNSLVSHRTRRVVIQSLVRTRQEDEERGRDTSCSNADGHRLPLHANSPMSVLARVLVITFAWMPSPFHISLNCVQ